MTLTQKIQIIVGRLAVARCARALSMIACIWIATPLAVCSPEVETLQDSTVQFKLLAEGRLIKKGASTASFARYESDGKVTLMRTIAVYSTQRKAQDELERMILEADKVIERGEKRDHLGKIVGKRAVIELTSSVQPDRRQVVLWSDGSSLYCLQSSRIDVDLAFEKLVYLTRDVTKPSQPKPSPLPLPE